VPLEAEVNIAFEVGRTVSMIAMERVMALIGNPGKRFWPDLNTAVVLVADNDASASVRNRYLWIGECIGGR
jgi:hypothetical protein